MLYQDDSYYIKFYQYLNKLWSLTSLPKKFCVALSGGSDSTFLLSMMMLLQKSYQQENIEVKAVIIDHGLRPESSIEAQKTKDYLQEKLLMANDDIAIISWHKNDHDNGNIHARARKARYNLIGEYCLENSLNYILTGHQQNDQAETILQRISRGCGIKGLRGIESNISFNNMIYFGSNHNTSISLGTKKLQIIRPLLVFSRQEIQSYLQKNNIVYLNDPSNKDTKYQRSEIRELLTRWQNLESNIITRISSLRDHSLRANDFIFQSSNHYYQKISYQFRLGFIIVQLEQLLKLHSELILQVLAKIISAIRGRKASYTIRFRSLMKLYNFCFCQEQKKITIAQCSFSKRKGQWLLISREYSKITTQSVVINKGESIIWDDRLHIVAKENIILTKMTDHDWKIHKRAIVANYRQSLLKDFDQLLLCQEKMKTNVNEMNDILLSKESMMTMPLCYDYGNRSRISHSLDIQNIFTKEPI